MHMGSKKRKAGAAGAQAHETAAARPQQQPPPNQKPSKRAAHEHTDAVPLGVGQQAAAAPGRLAKE
jgi:hypothetical protein